MALAWILYNIYSAKSEEVTKLKINDAKKDGLLAQKDGALREKDLIIQRDHNELLRATQASALKMLEEWKVKELETHKKRILESVEATYKSYLQVWINENETRIRKDSANRSVRNVMGKVAEHLIPFSEAFNEFNPKDARFIGSPIDLIVFDGVEENKPEITIFFIEVKTGTSVLSPRQKKIMEAITNKRVEWRRLTIKDFGDDVNSLLTTPKV